MSDAERATSYGNAAEGHLSTCQTQQAKIVDHVNGGVLQDSEYQMHSLPAKNSHLAHQSHATQNCSSLCDLCNVSVVSITGHGTADARIAQEGWITSVVLLCDKFD